MARPEVRVGLLSMASWAALVGGAPYAAAPPLPAHCVDYSTLSLRANDLLQDGFSLTVQAAAGLLGRRVPYEATLALAGNAFAPAIRPDETCTAWWHRYHRGLNMDLVGDALGLRFEPLDIPAGGLGAGMDGGELARRAAEQRRRAAATIGDAMRDGAVVITDSGWVVEGPHGFVPWLWWGIITSASESGEVLGATLNGRRDNPLEYVGACWAVTLTGPSLTPAEARARVLRGAVDRIRGRIPRPKASGTHFGTDAMDLWIGQMGSVPGFCAECEGRAARGWSCASDNAVALDAAAGAAATYLDEQAPSLPGPAERALQNAADHYRRIRRLLAPSLDSSGPASCERFVGDLEAQCRHVDRTLRPCRHELVAAADDIEHAIAALGERHARASAPSGTGSVDGVAPTGSDGNGFVRGLQVLLTHAGDDADYDTLMGDLGVAFITQASDQVARYDGALDVGWWPLDPSCLSAHLDFASKAAGRRLRFVTAPEGAPRHPDTLYRTFLQRELERAVGSGRPVLACADGWQVAVAYDRGTPPVLGFCPLGTDARPERLADYPWLLCLAGEGIPRMDRRAADLIALRHAIDLARDRVPMPNGFVTGRRAYALWAAALGDPANPGQARWHANMVRHLRLDRESATRYLRTVAGRHPRAVGRHLLAAAARYQQLLDALTEADTGESALASPEGRERLADLAEHLAGLDAAAALEVERALERAETPS